MLSTGLRFAALYTGRKVAITEVTTAMPSITSHERGPNTKMLAPIMPFIVLLRTAQTTKLAIMASTKQIAVMMTDSE